MFASSIPLWARLAALIALLITWPAMAGSIVPKTHAPAPSTLLTPVALACSRLTKQLGREAIINTCGACRIVKIQRKRPGSSAPINRTLTLAPKTTTQLSFRGPGRTRITSDRACKASSVGKLPARRSAAPSAGDGKSCIKITQTPAGIGLINACTACRAAVVERIDARGNRRSQTIVIAATSAMKLPAKGAAGVRIQSEKSCSK